MPDTSQAEARPSGEKPPGAGSPTTAFNLQLSPTRASDADRADVLRDPGWGRTFTDHMVTVSYTPDQGWHDAGLVPFGPLQLLPSTSVFNYGQAIFEGLKAYRQPDGAIAVFRADANARRFQSSARRLAMPAVPEPLFIESIRLLVEQDRSWVPDQPGQSLYLRPIEIATDAELMTRPSRSYLFVVIASPVASYFESGVRPVAVWLNTDYPRAALGGTGAAKFAGNYAAGMLGQALAAENGCDQVVWLDSREHRFVEEMGGMNIFLVAGDDRLITPPLTGTILPGVVRDSLITLGRELGLQVEERPVSIEEWETSAREGVLTEAFACGTAAVITPIGTVKHEQGSFTMGDGGPGKVGTTLRERLLDIQEGRASDTHGWMSQLIDRRD